MRVFFLLGGLGSAIATTRPAAPLAWRKVDALFSGDALFGGVNTTKYDPHQPPWGFEGDEYNETLQVQVGLQVVGVVVSTAASTADVSCWLRLRWYDPRLAYVGIEDFGADSWRPFSKRGGFSVNADKLWKPDLTVSNSYRNPFEDFMDMKITVWEKNHSGGNVYWSRPGKVQVGCRFDMSKYPFDKQTCDIEIESWVYDASQVKLVPMPNSATLVNSKPPMFNDIMITNMEFINAAPQYPVTSANPWSKEIIRLHLQRHPGTYITYVIAPMYLLVILASLAAWLEITNDGFDSDRVAYVATILLTAIATMLFFNEKRAMSGQDCWLDYYQCTCLALIVVVLMETFLVIWLDRHPHMIHALRNMFPNCCTCIPKNRDEGEKAKKMILAKMRQGMQEGNAEEVGQCALALDALERLDEKQLTATYHIHEMAAKGDSRDDGYERGSDVDDDDVWENGELKEPLLVCVRPGWVVDQYFRNIYPFLVVVVLGYIWSRVAADWEDNQRTTRAMRVMMAAVLSVQIALSLVAGTFILLKFWEFCRFLSGRLNCLSSRSGNSFTGFGQGRSRSED